MKSKIKTKGIVSLFLAIALLAGTCLSASALINSDWKSKTVNGKTYQYRASLSILSDRLYAATTIQSLSGTVPGGYMGAKAVLYKNGKATSSDDIYYEDDTTSSLTVYKYSYTNGTYYSQGVVAMYNGSGYTTDTTAATANGTYSLDSNDGYQVTENGETYGSGVLADVYGEFPDLIEAIGVNGVEGYVRFEDFIYLPETPEEAIAYSQSNENKYIPVYDLDGNVIDTFLLSAYDENTAVSGDINEGGYN